MENPHGPAPTVAGECPPDGEFVALVKGRLPRSAADRLDFRAVNRTSVDPLDPQAVWVLGVEGTGGANYNPFAQSVEVPISGCTGPTVQNFGIVSGCGGTVTFDARETLCAPGYTVCTGQQWASWLHASAPIANYWTDDNLGYSGANHACAAQSSAAYEGGCGTVANAQGQQVPSPMRVCTSIGPDSYGNSCNWTGCGLNGSANDHFGGCVGNATAGTLCCAD